jgi:hypothetical protein
MFIDVNDCTFVETIDYIILNSVDDIKMKNALSYLDAQGKLKGVTIYQIIYELFGKDIIEQRSIQGTKSIISNQDKRTFLMCKIILVIVVSFIIFVNTINQRTEPDV